MSHKILIGLKLNKSIIVIIISILLAVLVIPKFFKSDNVNAALEKEVVGGVRVGIQIYFARQRTYPATLDAAADGACDLSKGCFKNVYSNSRIKTNWKKAGFIYTGPNGGVYTYNPGTGSFK